MYLRWNSSEYFKIAFVQFCKEQDVRVDQLVKGRRATLPLSFETANKVPTAKNPQQLPQQRKGGDGLQHEVVVFSQFFTYFFQIQKHTFLPGYTCSLATRGCCVQPDFCLPSLSQPVETPRRLGPRFPSPGKTWSAVTFWFFAMAPRMEGEWRGRRGWGGMEAWMFERCQISAVFVE